MNAVRGERLALRNGVVFDSLTGSFRPGDLVMANGRITGLGRDAGSSDVEFDVTGAIISPGLIDMHAHVFSGQDLGVDADVSGPRSGTTTYVDAGSAGAHLWGAMHHEIAARATRIAAFINIASIGTTSIRLQGELRTAAYTDVDECVAAASDPARPAVGVKVRASLDVAGDQADLAVAAGRLAADTLGLPLMVHLGPAPATLEKILDALGPGDILTHCFTHFSANGMVRDGQILDAVMAARDRGVLFDVGHGASGFDVATASAALCAGFLPDTISTDLHVYSAEHVIDLPAVLTRFLAIGAPLPEVLRRATATPAAVLGLLEQGVGHLRVGGRADVAVLRVLESPHQFVDAAGTALRSSDRLVVEHTVRDGSLVFSRTATKENS